MSEPRRCQLSEVIEFRNGLNFSEKNDGRGLPIVKVKDFGDRHFVDHSNLDEINPAGIRVGENHLLRRNDIVLVRSNGNKDLVGRSMIFAGPDDTTAFAGFCIRGRVDCTKASPQYIHYWLRSPLTRERFSREGSGTGIQNVSQGLLNSLWISLPPLPEQREIAAILGALDDKIEVNRKASATLEAMARALYRSWFVDFDPVWAKLEGRPPAHMDPATAALFPDSFDDEGLPLGWELTTIGEVADIVGGGTPSTKQAEFWNDGHHLWATPKDLSNNEGPILLNTERRITDLGLAKISSGLLPAGSLLLSSRAPIGYLVIAQRPVAINQGFIGIRETSTVSGIEAYHWCVENMELIHANANGSTFQEIAKKNFRPLPYILAHEAVRQAFNKQAGGYFARIATFSEENQTLAALRDSLLPKLMSGEIRVGDAQDLLKEAI